MGRNRRQVLKEMGAVQQASLPFFAPEQFTITTDKKKGMYDERVTAPIDPTFQKSIKDYGVLDPVKFRFNGKDDNGDVIREIVEGRQRIRACLIANQERVAEGKEPWTVPAIQVYNEPGKDDAAMFNKITLMLNQQRMPNKPLYLARHALKMVEQGISKAEIGVFLRMTPQSVDNLLKLLHCSPKVQGLVQNGAPLELAKKLADLPREEQDEAAEKMLAEIQASGDGSIKKGLKGAKGRKVLEKVTGKALFVGPLSKKVLQKDLDAVVATLKAHKGAKKHAKDDATLNVVRVTLEYILQARKRRPWDVIAIEPEPVKTKPKRARKAKVASDETADTVGEIEGEADTAAAAQVVSRAATSAEILGIDDDEDEKLDDVEEAG